ncbi:MAG: hypothetical protein QOG00_1319 [Pyrinomonadaceae bacterium]|nr:hypothetical protein [Pyrinomonadaceae bacterium]
MNEPELIMRVHYDARLAASTEWRLPLCASAVCMKLEL